MAGDESDRPEEEAAAAGGPLGRRGGWANSPGLVWALLAILCMGVGASLLEPVVNVDLGWHLALGRKIVESGSIPATEPFTHTAAGRPMVAHEWLSQVVYAVLDGAAGFPGLRVLHAGLAAGLLVLLFALQRSVGVPPALALAVVATYAVLVQARLQIRPHMLHLCMFAALYGYVFVRRPALRYGELAAIGCATAFWANLHSGAVVFPAVVLVYVVAEAVQQRAGWRRPRQTDLGEGRLGRLAALLGVSGLAVLVTPHHVGLVPYVVESARVNAQLSQEWFPITHFWVHREHLGFALEAWWLTVAATLATAVAVVGRTSSARLAVALVVLLAPFSAMRHISFAFVPLLFVAEEVGAWLGGQRSDADAGLAGAARQPLGRALAVACLGGALLLAVFALRVPVALERAARAPGVGLHAGFRGDLFPVGAASFLDEVGLGADLYHPSRWGGYLLLRTHARYRTFADGRWVTLGVPLVLESASIDRRMPGFLERLEKHGVGLLVVPRGWMTDEIREAGWLTLFENWNAGVYLRRNSDTEADLRRVVDYYAAVRVPFDSEAGFDERAALESNPEWARGLLVRRRHLAQFGISPLELDRTGGRVEFGW